MSPGDGLLTGVEAASAAAPCRRRTGLRRAGRDAAGDVILLTPLESGGGVRVRTQRLGRLVSVGVVILLLGSCADDLSPQINAQNPVSEGYQNQIRRSERQTSVEKASQAALAADAS